MNSHTSPYDHMSFVANSSSERTWVPRRMTDRLAVRRLVNINPGQPRTSSTAAPRKPQHHRLRSPRSESKSFSFLNQAHGVKRAIKEVREGGGAAAPARRAHGGTIDPARRARGGAAATARRARGGAAAPSREGEAAEAAPVQGGATTRGAPACSKSRLFGCLFSVKMLYEAWQSPGKLAIHLGVQLPLSPL
jgi:hypothetical protein